MSGISEANGELLLWSVFVFHIGIRLRKHGLVVQNWARLILN
jgi:hypothetical protein